jgi:hypothetical protein
MIKSRMKRDGRKLDHRTLEEIRKMAVIVSYGFHYCVIFRWLKAANKRGKGIKALAARKLAWPPLWPWTKTARRKTVPGVFRPRSRYCARRSAAAKVATI